MLLTNGCNMDKRHHKRVPTAVTTVIYQDTLATIGGKTRDLSLGGMFIETGPITLPVGTPLEVGIVFNGGHKERVFRLAAKVVHRCGEGMGLMFCSRPSEEFARQLHGLRENHPGRKSAAYDD